MAQRLRARLPQEYRSGEKFGKGQVADVICDREVIEEIPSGPITKTEIRSTILSMSAGTAPDIDGITVELL